MSRPPARSAFSITVTSCPSWFSRSAAASPEGPLPITATRFSVRTAGIRGWIQPLANPVSIMDPAFGKPGLNQIQFVIPVGNAVVLQVARFFAQRRADVSRKFREGCRLQQALQRLPFLAAVQQIVPLRDQVMQRASEIRLAERHAAVHAAGRLCASGLASLRDMQVFEVAEPFRFIPEGILYSYCVQKSCCAAHSLTLPSSSSGIRLR